MEVKVCKFGGTSMADAKSINNIKSIVYADNSRKYIVVSAPGKRFSGDDKVTDLLYKCHKDAVELGNCAETFAKIRARYADIIADLGLNIDITDKLNEIEAKINQTKSADYAASRGEYLGAYCVSVALGFDFVDAADIIYFNKNGILNEEATNDAVGAELAKHENAVIPGFYGKVPNGDIKTFSRGGSDVTGAIIARGVVASVYENWTDVSGFMTADPRIVKNPIKIDILSYKELRELSYMGASVLHPDSIFPIKNIEIPINIKNTFEPDNDGTWIVKDCESSPHLVTGIAGKKGFMSFTIEKSMMNNQIGFFRKVLSVFEKFHISIEHTPTGIDTLSIIVSESEAKGRVNEIIVDLNKHIAPDSIEITENLALVATVGRGMAKKIGTAAKLFTALSKNQINIQMIDQGSSELNIIVAVHEEDYENTIISIYNEFMK